MGQSAWAVPPSAGGVALSRDLRKTAKLDEEAKSNLAIEFQSCSTLQVGAAAPGTLVPSCTFSSADELKTLKSSPQQRSARAS